MAVSIDEIMNFIEQSNASNIDKKEIRKYLEELEDDSLFLGALETNGVDNWDFYDEAFKDYQSMKGENNEG